MAKNVIDNELLEEAEKLTDSIIILAPMVFTREDYEQQSAEAWEQLRQNLLNNIRESYEYLMDHRIKQKGWQRV